MRTLGITIALATMTIAVGACTSPPPAAIVDLGTGDLVDCVANPVACGGCLSDGDCHSATNPRCDVVKRVCIPCLPANDNCPTGQVCTQTMGSFACSSTCTTNNDCTKISGPGTTCCGGACHTTLTDTSNCGGCNAVCPTVQNGTNACVEGRCGIGSCSGTFVDCDHLLDNGCETDTASDAVNCGACGKVCPMLTNGNPACAAGACSSSCKQGFADCNKNLSDGCETDVTFDVKNCGACGAVVTPPKNASAYCDNGKASFRCTGHFFDCDGNPANGCELDASKDATNCGHCGNVCPGFTNSTPACVNAACANVCNANFGDCDQNVGNGCETALLTDPNNCGACGAGCHGINASAVCAGGVCTLTCKPNYVDCNNNAGDGCEADLLTDANNCNGCGNVCPMATPSCVGGKCLAGCLNGKQPPSVCTAGKDLESNAPWVVCSADCTQAWVANNGAGGSFHALQICQTLGYTKLGQYGGTCGTICGYCGAGSCNANGNKTFDGGGNAGSDAFGQILASTVHWICLP